MANFGSLALWICNRRYPQLVSPRGWIYLHALRGVLLYSAPGIAVWFAFQSPQTDLPLLHTVMLVTLAAGVFMSNGFDLLNFSTAIPFLLFPSIVLHFGSHTFDRTILAIVLAFFFCAINVYAMSYRKLFRQVVQARVDQQYLAESLAAQKHVAEEASLAKTRFFAAASHDLRQPLHAIGLLAASLNDAAATPAQHAKTAEHIVYNVEALNQLFNQVLDLARLESGVTQVIRLHFRLSELFERVGSQYRPQAAAKGLALRIAPTTMVVHDDPVLLERVLSNLLSNAVRYTEDGAIWLGFRRAGRQSGRLCRSARFGDRHSGRRARAAFSRSSIRSPIRSAMRVRVTGWVCRRSSGWSRCSAANCSCARRRGAARCSVFRCRRARPAGSSRV